MKNYTFFKLLLLFLITIYSCTSNDALSPMEISLRNHQDDIKKLKDEMEQLKYAMEEVHTIENLIDNLNTFLANHNEELEGFTKTFKQIEIEIEKGDSNLNETITNLQEQLHSFIGDHKIFYGNIHISSKEDYTLFSEKKYKIILGNLTIQHTDLKNLKGLESLTSVGALILRNNPFLESTEGMDNLISISSDLIISDNPLLKEITFFNITKIEGDLCIRRNTSLSSLRGLQNINSVGRRLVIDDRYSLRDLDGLRNLTSVSSLFIVSENNSSTQIIDSF